MEIKLFDSELKIMEILWKGGETTARSIAETLKEQIGWSKTTTYTVIKKCIDKGVVNRKEPGFVCRPLITKEQVQEVETRELIDKMYDGGADRLVASLFPKECFFSSGKRRYSACCFRFPFRHV